MDAQSQLPAQELLAGAVNNRLRRCAVARRTGVGRLEFLEGGDDARGGLFGLSDAVEGRRGCGILPWRELRRIRSTGEAP